jgi:hypothetical protein
MLQYDMNSKTIIFKLLVLMKSTLLYKVKTAACLHEKKTKAREQCWLNMVIRYGAPYFTICTGLRS